MSIDRRLRSTNLMILYDELVGGDANVEGVGLGPSDALQAALLLAAVVRQNLKDGGLQVLPMLLHTISAINARQFVLCSASLHYLALQSQFRATNPTDSND